MRISAEDAATCLKDLLERAADGDEVIIETNGQLLALVPLDEPLERRITPWSEKTIVERRALLDRLHGAMEPPEGDTRTSRELLDALYDERGLPA